jgi:hypothetical protein
MRARIGITLGQYWGGIAYAIDVMAAISALGAIGGLPALLNMLATYTRFAVTWLRGPHTATTSARHRQIHMGEIAASIRRRLSPSMPQGNAHRSPAALAGFHTAARAAHRRAAP